jgi:hypothetical protein
VLAVALLLRTLVVDWPGALGEVVAEGLLILAWVALWRPAEIVLFDQWESRDRLRRLQRLAVVPVEFVGSDGSQGGLAASRQERKLSTTNP